MFKLTFILSFIILGTLICANYHNVDCNSCGEECKRACGTKQFKICCYNYLRKKRAPEPLMVLSPFTTARKVNLPFYIDNMAAQEMLENVDQYKYYPNEDYYDMRLINDL